MAFLEEPPADDRPRLGHRRGPVAGPGGEDLDVEGGERFLPPAAPADGLVVRQGTLEILLGDLLQAVGDDLGRVDQERLEEQVAGEALDGETLAAQRDPQELGVVGDLGPLGVEEPGAEPLEPRSGEAGPSDNRHQARPAGLGAEDEGGERAVDRRTLVVDRQHRHRALGGESGEQGVDLGEAAAGGVVGLLDRGPADGLLVAEQREELELAVEGVESGGRRRLDGQIVEGHLEGQAAVDRRQLAGQERPVAVLLEALPKAAFELAEVVEDGGEGTVAGEELRRPFRPDARHPGDVVGAVADQRQVVGEMLRPHAPALAHQLGVVDHVAHRVEHPHPVGDELGEVLVAGDDDDLHAGLDRPPGEGADHVVGLVARNAEQREVVGCDQTVDGGKLGFQVLRHRLPPRLVLAVLAVAGGRARRVEDHRPAPRPAAGEDLPKHRREAVDGVRRPAGGGRQAGGQGVVRPVEEGVAVDQDQAVGRGHGGPG